MKISGNEIKNKINNLFIEKKNLEKHIIFLKEEINKIPIYKAEINILEQKIILKEKLIRLRLKKISQIYNIPEPIFFSSTEPHYIFHTPELTINETSEAINVAHKQTENKMLDPIDSTKEDYKNINKIDNKSFGLYYHHHTSPDIAHQVIHANEHFFIRYAPWVHDEEFAFIYNAVKDYSMVDMYRFYDLFSFIKQLKDVNGVFLEVGVANGGTGTVIAYVAKNLSKKCYLADTWKGVVKASDKDTSYFGGEFDYASAETVLHLLSCFDLLQNTTLLEGIFPDQTGQNINEKIAFLHVDVDTYDSCKDVIEWAKPKMSIGGVIVFDDYGFMGLEGVTRYANEFSKDPNYIYSYNLNGHATFVKIKD